MDFTFNWLGLGMLGLSVVVWFCLALLAPGIGGSAILAVAILVLFAIDVTYRATAVRRKILALKRERSIAKVKPTREDLNVLLPLPIAAAITNLGGSLMLVPCWIFAVFAWWVVFYAFEI